MYTANGYIPCGGRVPAPLDCNYPPYEAKVRQILRERCKVNIDNLFTHTLGQIDLSKIC